MQISLILNDTSQTWDIPVNETLLDALRRHGVFGVKQGCQTGECGACTVLLDDMPVTSCTMLAAQTDGHRVTTVEAAACASARAANVSAMARRYSLEPL